MARPRPVDPPALASLKPAREPFLSAEIHVVTPMFGGGAVAGVPDADLPIHGAAVRGHLRFWWRACFGSRYSSAPELFRAESEVWGQAATAQGTHSSPSAVDVSVEIVSPGTTRPCAIPVFTPQGGYRAKWVHGLDAHALPYALWPFQGKGANGIVTEQPSEMREGLALRVKFSFARHVAPSNMAKINAEVSAAVWAWVNFGGVGSRTRRGCGALFCADFAPEGDPGRWFRQTAGQHVRDGQRVLPIPVLSNARVLMETAPPGHEPRRPIAAWSRSVAWLQEFRQGVNQGRNPGRQPNRPGRSRWPEADSVREMLGLHDPQHQPAHPARPLFPRADLGLPIIFQRMGSGGPDPSLTVSSVGASRFASPVIVKPLAVAPDRALPMAVVLDAPRLWEVAPESVQLQSGYRVESVPADLLHDPRKSANVPPLHEEPAAREAFLKYVRTKASCVEVTL